MDRVVRNTTAAQVNAGVSANDYALGMKAASAVIKLAGGSVEDYTVAMVSPRPWGE
jgi:hypothetical protein